MEERISEWSSTLQAQASLLEEIVREQSRRIESLERVCAGLSRELAELKAGLSLPADSLSAGTPAAVPAPEPESTSVSEYGSVPGRSSASGPCASRPAWLTDMAGMQVAAVRNALSLNDRIVLMRELFDGNAASMDLALDLADRAETLDGFVAQMRRLHPDWDEASDPVYRFYMVARRKIRK